MTLRFTNLNGFEKDLNKFADAIGRDAGEVLRASGLKLFRGITRRTPVDTGYARASWKLARNSPNTSVPDKKKFPPGGNGDTAGEAENAKELSGFGPEKTLDPIFVTNSLPYIVSLENGHSKQSDKGFMVQRTLIDLKKEIDDAVREVS